MQATCRFVRAFGDPLGRSVGDPLGDALCAALLFSVLLSSHVTNMSLAFSLGCLRYYHLLLRTSLHYPVGSSYPSEASVLNLVWTKCPYGPHRSLSQGPPWFRAALAPSAEEQLTSCFSCGAIPLASWTFAKVGVVVGILLPLCF